MRSRREREEIGGFAIGKERLEPSMSAYTGGVELHTGKWRDAEGLEILKVVVTQSLFPFKVTMYNANHSFGN